MKADARKKDHSSYPTHPLGHRNRLRLMATCLSLGSLLPGANLPASIPAHDSGLRLPFIENQGQLPPAVAFHIPVFAGSIGIMKDGTLTYSIPHRQGSTNKEPAGEGRVILHETLVAPEAIHPSGKSPSQTRVNCFIGKQDQWKTSIRTFNTVTLGEALPGITILLEAHDNTVEKLYSVSPNSNPSSIQWRITGAKSLEVDPSGQLSVHTTLGEIRFSRPIAWQEKDGKRQPVPIAYRCATDHYGFEVGAYDRSRELLIDPLLASSFLGSGNWEAARAITKDATGNIIVAGEAQGGLGSPYLPTTSGGFSTLFNGNDSDVFVSKFDPTLSTLLASTFIGGHTNDVGYGVAVDQSNNVYVVGMTSSTNFPITPGAAGSASNGLQDAFIAKLDNSLSVLLACTRIGGTNEDEFRSVQITATGDIICAGSSQSGDFPTTAGVFQPGIAPGGDAVICRLNNTLSNLLASTFLGGSGLEMVTACRLGESETIYLTGYTTSPDLPVPPNAYQSVLGGWVDGFVGALSPGLSNLVGLTYLGGTSEDRGIGLAVDTGGVVYVVGEAVSRDFPTTPTTLYPSAITLEGYGNGFICSLGPKLTNLLAGTYLAGTGTASTSLEAIEIDSNNQIYVAGASGPGNYPMTTNSYDTSFNGIRDVIVSRLPPDLSRLDASTYLGGDGDDLVHGMVLDPTNGIYLAGQAQEAQNFISFPSTPNSYDRSHNGDMDAFISLLDLNLSAFPAPGHVRVSNGDFTDFARITWTGAPFIAGYIILRHTTNDLASALAVGTTATTNFDDTSAIAGETCWYWVMGTNGIDHAVSSPDYGSRGILSAPLPPTGLMASKGDYTNRVQLIWTDSDSAEGYTLWRSDTYDFATARPIGSTSGTTANDTNALPGGIYAYFVRATNSFGSSGFNTPPQWGFIDHGNYQEGLELPTPVSVTSTGNATWFVQGSETHDGMDACQSGPVPDDGWTELRATVTGPGTLSFWWKASSEQDYDLLGFYIDAPTFIPYVISGTTLWTQEFFEVESGTHELVWYYQKDGLASDGADAGWVDEVTWTPRTWTITGTTSGSGMITPSNILEVLEGTSTNVTLVPAPYYSISNVMVDALSSGTLAQVTFANVMTNHTLSVIFSPNLTTNGTPEWWLAMFGWTNNFDAAAQGDTDGDGHNAHEEYLSGTLPTNNASILRIVNVQATGASNGLEWVTFTNWVDTPFRVLRSTNLASGIWEPASGTLDRTPPTNTWWDTTPPENPGGFYRVVTTNAAP